MSEEFGEKLTTQYSDKLKVERNKFINDYARERIIKKKHSYSNSDEINDSLIYIYDKNSQDDEKFNAVICKEGMEHEVIELNYEDLPEEAGKYSILEIKDGKYVLDEEATKEVSDGVKEIINRIVEEQKKELQNNRIEGHIYQVSEISTDRMWLYDISQNSDDGIEEIEELEVPYELVNQISIGDKIIYENGTYKKY